MACGDHRGYLHFSAADSSTPLNQMEAWIKGSAYIILDMNRVAADYSVYKNQVNTITLRKPNGIFERRLSRWYIKYAVNRRGDALKFPTEMGLHNWAEKMGAEPTQTLKRFFRNPNLHARAVLMEENLQLGKTAIIEAERAALLAASANSTEASSSGSIPPNTELSVVERARSGEPWCLTSKEMAPKELHPYTNTVTIDCVSPVPLNGALLFIREVTNLLNTERTPKEGVEQRLMDCINPTHDYE